jgi:predicted dehydrogenase
MVTVAIIGLGGMGRMHLGCYASVPDADVVAIADVDEAKLRPGETALEINIGESKGAVDPDRHSLYTSADELIQDPDVQLVDICLPTYLHAQHCRKALAAGKHVLCEKPMALTYDECRSVLDAQASATGRLMIAQCVRFFPAYEHLAEAVRSRRLGRLIQLSLWRGTAPPRWSWDGWLLDHARSGGGMMDLHVHDADFVNHLLGRPAAVCSTGAVGPSGGYDVVDTQYIYPDRAAVRAGGNLAMPEGFGFEAHFTAVFEHGGLAYSTAAPGAGLTEYAGGQTTHPDLPATDGYRAEIEYFVGCIERGEEPSRVPPDSSALSVRIVEAERESIESGRAVAV